MSLPAEFLTQYQALIQSVGFAHLPGRTNISVTGADRIQFLQSFTTNDIKKLAIGAGCEAFVTSPQGKTLGHLFIFAGETQHILDTTPGQRATLIAHFDRYVITEAVQFIDRTGDRCEILVAGPEAAALLETLSGRLPPAELLGHVPATVAGNSVVLRRVDYAGANSFFLQASIHCAAEIISALTQAGSTPCEEPAVEAARLEAGFPLFGIDITPENLPQEVARDAQAISFTKGCYLGQETVARIDAIGHVNRLLVGLKFEGTEVPASSTAILAGDQQIGHVTSAAWSPRLAAPLALAYLRRNHAKPGNVLSSSVGPATVIALPLR
jgi:tRNA-modifying protein YgfZ